MPTSSTPDNSVPPTVSPVLADARYMAVVENLGEGMLVLRDRKILFCNSRACAILQLSPQTLLGADYLQWLHPDDQQLSADRQMRRQRGELVTDRFEIRYIGIPGKLIWLEQRAAAMQWEGMAATVSFFSDVTERRTTRDALERSEQRYRLVVEHLGEGMGVIQDGKVMYANQRACALMGAPHEQLMGSYFQQWLHPDDRGIAADRQQRRQRGEVVPERYETRRLAADGSIRWLEVHATAVPWEGRPATMSFFSDVTDRHQLQTRLTQTLHEREAILNSAVVGIAYTLDERHEWVNDKYAEMLGYSSDELIGMPTVTGFLNAEQWQNTKAAADIALAAHGAFSAELQFKHRSGKLFWVESSGRRVEGISSSKGGAAADAAIWTVLDITRRKRAEEDIKDALRRQQELNTLRSRFVAMTSHEFRTPLATIMSSAELLKYYSGSLADAEKDEVLGSIEIGVQRMTRMLDRVLLIGKADAKMLEFAPESVDLPALCQSFVREARTLHPASLCSVNLTIDKNLADPNNSAHYDEKLLRHIFVNLLSNALKYSPSNTPVQFQVFTESGRTVFVVSDQGIGIPADEVDDLFESFHRASNVGDIAGTGLGLAIVKSSADAHGGTIEVHSIAQRGTTFTVRL